MKKYYLPLILSIFTLLCFTACKTDGLSGDSSNSTPPTTTEGAIWSPGSTVYLQVEENAEWDTNAFAYSLGEIIGAMPKSGAGEHEIVVGNIDHPLAKKAYSLLDDRKSDVEVCTTYLIYTDGNSVAFAYDSDAARIFALNYFLKEYDTEVLKFKPGIVACKETDLKEYARVEREKRRNEGYSAAAEIIGSGAASALKDFYSLTDDSLYIWLANLWDPDMGGFYYSNSARNTEGFLPDIESTAQVLDALQSTGMLVDRGNSYANAFDAKTRAKILEFAKGLQDSGDGYFYHEQWGKAITTSRRGRDLGWATQIIKKLGGKPYYNTPNGHKGELGAPGAASASALTSALSSGKTLAVSKITPTSSLPSYLKDLTLWKEYLEGLNFSEKSYSAGNTLDAQTGQISQASSEIKNYLHEFLDSHQFASTGLWEDRITYDSINGLMKISGVYSSFGWTINYAETALNSAIEIIMTDDPAGHVCSVFNPWVSIVNLFDAIEKSGGTERVDELRQTLRADAEALIRTTLNKISVFKKDDGGFSYFKNYCSATSQGAQVAVNNTAESDVNASIIAGFGITRRICAAMGIPRIYAYCGADYYYFEHTFNNLYSIIKDELPPVEVIDFNDYDKQFDEIVGGVSMEPAEYVTSQVGDKDVDSDGSYTWFRSAVVDDPATTGRKKVLFGKSIVYSGLEKNKAEAASGFRFEIPNAALQTTAYVFESDIYIASATKDTTVGQLFFTNKQSNSTVSLNLNSYTYLGKQYLRFGENYQGLDGTKDGAVAGAIPIGEWTKLRVEAYKVYETDEESSNGLVSSTLKIKVKIFINDIYQGECDAGYVSTGSTKFSERTINRVSFSFYRHSILEMYFDNVLAEKTYDKYEKSYNAYEKADEYPDGGSTATFEDGILNTKVAQNKLAYDRYGTAGYTDAPSEQSKNTSVAFSIVSDPTGAANKVLSVTTNKAENYHSESGEFMFADSKTVVKLSNPKDSGTTYTLCARMYFDSESIKEPEDLFTLSFANELEKANYTLRFKAYEEWDTVKLNVFEANIDDKGNGRGSRLASAIPTDEWIDIKIELYRTGDKASTYAKLYIGDSCVADDNTCRIYAVGDGEISRVNISYNSKNSAKVYLDDLALTRSEKTHTPLPGTETDSATVATFENGAFNTKYLFTTISRGDVPTVNVEEITDMAAIEGLYNTFYISEDPTNSANKVLKSVRAKQLTSTGAANRKYDATTNVFVSNDTPDGNCYTFETKIYISKVNYDTTYIRFNDTKGNEIVEYRLYHTDKGYIELWHEDSTAGTGRGYVMGLNGTKVTLNPNVWYTLKIEFYRTGISETTMSKIYLATEGAKLECVADANNYSISSLDTEFSHVSLAHTSNRPGTVYLDDISLSRTDKSFAYSKLPELLDQPTADFEEGVFNTKYLTNTFAYFNAAGGKIQLDADKVADMSAYEGTSTTYSLATDPANAANKVLKVTKVKGSAEPTTKITPSTAEMSGNCVVFEMKMYSSKVQYDRHYIYFMGVNSSGASKNMFGLYMNQPNGSTYQLRENNANGTGKSGQTMFSASLNSGTLPYNTWFTLRIELYLGGTAETSMAKIFVDTADGSGMQCVADGNFHNGYPGYNFTHVSIEHDTNRSGINYFDDISLKVINKEYSPEK
ncbi:MAG: hypothetical protein J6B48_01950 [Clostridia bacterium]|nr:hypothetical protein [Clostridia bacterium]